MENQSTSLGELLLLELFIGSITFVLGTCCFVFLLWNAKVKLKKLLLLSFLQIIFSIFFSTFFLKVWQLNIDVMLGLFYLPGILAELITISLFYIVLEIKKTPIDKKD